jgi:hypothetical protein
MKSIASSLPASKKERIMFTVARHIVGRRWIVASLMICALSNAARAQDQSQAKPSGSNTLITAAATTEHVRFTAPNTVAQLRLEVYAEAGQKVYDTELRGGSVVDWHLQDSDGQRVASGTYACLLTVRSLSGRISQKLGLVTVAEKTTAVRTTEAAALSAQQAQAVGPLEGNTALAILGEQEAPAATVVTHDGTDAQLTRTRGALSFRAGDLFAGTDREQMRLTEEGDLGVGTDQPEARLDVNGMVRARQGFQFADGSVLNLAPQGTGLRVTLPSGEIARVNFAPSAVNGTAHRIPKFAADGSSLQDSNIYQDPNNGNIGIGTTTPAHPFVVRRNGGTLGVHSFGELFVDRDDRTRSASLTVGTAGTLKWIFGMPYNSDGFQVYDLTNNVSRFFVDPTSGNIGIGTTTPGKLLDVNGTARFAPGGSGGVVEFGPAGGETGMAIIGTGANATRADVRYDGSLLKLVAGVGTSTPASTNGIVVKTDGNVGIGTLSPTTGRLNVFGSAGQPAIYAETTNRGVWGKSTGSSYGVYGESASGIGVQGVSVSNIGVGGISSSNVAVAGTSTSSIGVRGETASGSPASPGVQGVSTGAGGVGVRGDGTTGVYGTSPNGTGVTGESATGYAMYANGNAGQARDKGGFVKAMLYVNPFLPASQYIVRCYNGQTNSSTGNCGFTMTRSNVGLYEINFGPGFTISDRFFSLTPEGFVSASLHAVTNNEVQIFTFLEADQGGSAYHGTDSPFYIVVY